MHAKTILLNAKLEISPPSSQPSTFAMSKLSSETFPIDDDIPIMSHLIVAGSNNEEHMSMLVAGLSACLGTQC